MPALTLQPTSRFHLVKGEGQIVWYEVVGLPVGEKAKVANVRGRWRILQKHNEIPTEWRGEYASAEEALAALQAETAD